jgi:phage terminase large subunit-like protein
VSKREEAVRWLAEVLQDGPVMASEAVRLAGEEGISERTLRRATAELGVHKTKMGAPGDPGQAWAWELAVYGSDAGQRTDAFALLGSLTLEDGRPWGTAAEEFQRVDAAAILSPTGPRLHYLTRPRGASKTTDLAAVCIAALLTQLPPRGRAFVFACDQDQSALLLDALSGFVARTEGLAGALKVDNYRVTTPTGARLDIMAADAASAWGIKGHLIVVDEFCQWPTTPGPRRLWHAILSAVPKVAGCRLVLLSTAGDPSHPSHKLLGQAKTSTEWRVNETPGPTPWINERALDEQRNLLPQSVFDRLHMNIWTASEDRLVDPEALADAVRFDGPQEPKSGAHYWIGLDVGLKHDATVGAICHGEHGDGAAHVALDRLLVWQGSRLRPVKLDDVEAAVLDASRRYNRASVRLDPWQAVGLGQRLTEQGVTVDEYAFGAQSVGRLASTLHMLLRNRRVSLYEDAELLDELATVRLKETSPGVLRMDHDPDKHDDRAIALALAALAIVEGATGPANAGTVLAAMGPIRRRDPDVIVTGDSPLVSNPWQQRGPWRRDP